MAKQPRLDVLSLERLLQEWIVEQVDLAHRQGVGGPPVSIHLPRFVSRKWTGRCRLKVISRLAVSFCGCGGRHRIAPSLAAEECVRFEELPNLCCQCEF